MNRGLAGGLVLWVVVGMACGAWAAGSLDMSRSPNQRDRIRRPPVNTGARAVFVDPEYHAGTVVEGETIRHDFVIQNAGTSALVIDRVYTSCGCVSVVPTPRIEPGRTGTISVAVDTDGYGGKDLEQDLRVFANDPEAWPRVLFVRARVEPFVTLIPDNVNLSGTLGQGPISQTLRLVPNPDAPLTIPGLGRTTKRSGFSYTVEKTPDNEYRVTVTNTMTTPGGYFERLSIPVQSSLLDAITIPVRGNIQ